jgi:6-phosphogluconate dehydrogenase
MDQANIGIVGLGVMGSNLALNIERNGFIVAGYDIDVDKMNSFLQGSARGKEILCVKSPEELMSVLEKPRRILIMVPAGMLVGSAIAHLKPFLEPGDILIDGGNSFFIETERRSKELEGEGFNYIGTGISGGEEGALWGPSIMPGGQYEAWEALAPIFRKIAARAGDGKPCVTYIGPRGAGHYVKMVHNGIEYGDMQLIAEIYDILHRVLRMSAPELADVFMEWNQGELKSYLIEITAQILSKKDEESDQYLVDVILDEAQQKGTGKWASQNALDIGSPIPTINAAVESRIISSLKNERVHASRVLLGPKIKYQGNKDELINAAKDALYLSKITSYAQGLSMLGLASKEYEYSLDLAEIVKIWRAGCIIRASLLNDIMGAYVRNPGLVNLLLDDSIRTIFESRQAAWRKIVCTAVELGIPALAASSSLAYYDAYRCERLPANLTQAQRDFFGAHTYRRLDRDGVFHTQWIQGKNHSMSRR